MVNHLFGPTFNHLPDGCFQVSNCLSLSLEIVFQTAQFRLDAVQLLLKTKLFKVNSKTDGPVMVSNALASLYVCTIC